MRQKLRVRSILIAIFIVGLLSPVFAFAQNLPNNSIETQQFAQASSLATTASLGVIIARIINVALGFMGVVATVLIIYAGFQWMTSRGEEEKVKRARKIIVQAVIGLGIILIAFGIVQWVLRVLGVETNPDSVPTPASTTITRGTGGGLGSVVEAHFPGRSASGIGRNVRILVTFKDAVNPASIATSSTGKFFTAMVVDGAVVNRVPEPGLKMRLDAVAIVKTADIKNATRDPATAPFHLGRETSGAMADVLVSFTPDLRTYMFTPVERGAAGRPPYYLLGSSNENIGYTVYLCGVKPSRGSCTPGGIKILPADVRAKAGEVGAADLLRGSDALGTEAFGGTFPDYEWSFEVGTFVDTTPPTIKSIIPLPDKNRDGAVSIGRPDKPRNTIVQVNFSEAMMPTVMYGRVIVAGGQLTAASFNTMQVASGAQIIAGNWDSGNQYLTSEFTSVELCGKNSCGQNVYCLPGGAPITVKLHTAPHVASRDFSATSDTQGLQDAYGNALDGNKNNKPDGATNYYDMACDGEVGETSCSQTQSNTGDNVTWNFWTNALIELKGPTITRSVPGFAEGNVAPSEPVNMTFSRPMSLVSLNSRTIDLSGFQASSDQKPWEGWWDIESTHVDVNGDRDPDASVSEIRHGDFWTSTDFRNKVSREVKDIYQNCYFPSGGGSCSLDNQPEGANYCCDGSWQSSACF